VILSYIYEEEEEEEKKTGRKTRIRLTVVSSS